MKFKQVEISNFYWPIYDNMICIFVIGEEMRLANDNQEEEISESTSRRWLESNVSMFDSLKLCFNFEQNKNRRYFQQTRDHLKHATKAGQGLEVGEGQEETKRQSQLHLLRR